VAAGAEGEARGEVVFNTSMTGYQEVLTDPSYSGQIVTMTCPEMAITGLSGNDVESRGVRVAGFVVREESPMASNWRADGTLRDYLIRQGIVAIAGIDTRELTRRLRSVGVMRGSSPPAMPLFLRRWWLTRAPSPPMEGYDLVRGRHLRAGVRLARRRSRPVRHRAGATRQAAVEDRCLRLRHEVEHHAAIERARL